MSIVVEYKKNPQFLFVKVTGEWTTQDAFKIMEEIKIKADELGIKRILLDMLDLSSPESEITRYYTGEKVAAIFSFQYKIASYSQLENTNKFAETVAVNRGVNTRVFSNKFDAINWLTS